MDLSRTARQTWLFIDLDGTIIEHEHHTVVPSALEALHRARQRGHRVVLATGRTPSELFGEASRLPLDGLIAANGRYAEYKGEQLLKRTIPKDSADRLVSWKTRQGVPVLLLDEDHYASSLPMDETGKNFLRHFNLPVPTVDARLSERRLLLQLVLLEQAGSCLEYAKCFPELDFQSSCPYAVDVNVAGGMKEEGMRILMEAKDDGTGRTIAIGDGGNDLTLLMEADVGVAMGNASEALKAKADFVTETVERNGLYLAFERLGLI